MNLEKFISKQRDCAPSVRISSTTHGPVSTHPLPSPEGETSVDVPSHEWKINKYFKSTVPDQEHNIPPQNISNLFEASKMASTSQSFDTQSNSSVESMNIIMYPSQSCLLEIEKSKKKMHNKKISTKHENYTPKEIQYSNNKNKMKISKKKLNQKLKKNVSNEPSKQTKKHPKPLLKSMLVANKTSLASCKTGMLEPKSFGNPVPLDSTCDQSAAIKKRKATVKKRPENYGSRTTFLISDMQCLEQKSKQCKKTANFALNNSSSKVAKRISSIESNKDSTMSSTKNLTVPSSKLDQHDSKTQEISTDNLKSNNTTVEYKLHMPKCSSIEFELAERDPENKLKELHLQPNVLNNVPETPEHACADISTKQHTLNAPCDKKFNLSCSSRIESLDICLRKESNTITSHSAKNKMKISKKKLNQKLKKKKNVSNEPSKQTKKHLRPLLKSMLVTNKTSLASCKTGMLEPKSFGNPVPLDSTCDQSAAIKKKKTTVKKRPENYGSRAKFLLSDMQCLEQKSKQCKKTANFALNNSSSKVAKQISSIESNKDSTMSSTKDLTVPSSKLDQHDSKTQAVSTDNLKSNNTTVEYKLHMPKCSSIEFELAERDPENKLKELQQNVLNNVPEVPEHACADISTKQHTLNAPCDKKINLPCSSRIESLDICSKNELNTITSPSETTKICADKKLPEASMTSKSNKDKISNNMCATITSEDFCIKLIKMVVELNPKWLYERLKNVEPPPDISKGAKSLPLSFDSFDLYVSHLFPMLILEVWEELSFYAMPILISNSEKKFYFCILSCEYVHGMLLLNCESIVNENVSFVPNKNSAVILQLKEKGGRDVPSFGFIKHHEFKQLDINYVHLHKWQHLPENWTRSAKLYCCQIYTKSRVLNLMDCLLEGNGICNLNKKVTLSYTLNHLQFAPFIKDILIPTLNTFTVSYKEEKNCCDYNSIQKNICSSVCEVMILPPSVPKIILLQGPPGSGKTTSVARIAEKLCRDFNMKVLILAPSNFAVDEIGHQLVQLNEMSDNSIHFIRLGSSKSPKLFSHSCENILKSRQTQYESEYLQYQHDMKMAEDKFLHSLLENQNCENFYGQFLQALNELNLIQRKELKQWDHSVEEKVTMDILQNSKIILSTITDCVLYFKTQPALKFSCCIIDEINQATELDTLLPFSLEINKFLLVGDPKQLAPVVKSKLALSCGFQRSIMERFQLYFKMENGFNPAIILTKQFRMPTEIGNFPLQYFYSLNCVQVSKLCSGADKRSKNFPFKPYAVFNDITELRTTDKLFRYEMLGIEVIMCFCSLFIKSHPSSSIAIIVPSEEEKKIYLPEVVKKFPRSAIEVDTFESFQGREKSIIILSCFKDITSGLDDFLSIFCDERKLNVALTRALNTLVICGPIYRFLNHRLWDVLIQRADWEGCYTYYTHLNDYSRLFEEYLLKK